MYDRPWRAAIASGGRTKSKMKEHRAASLLGADTGGGHGPMGNQYSESENLNNE